MPNLRCSFCNKKKTKSLKMISNNTSNQLNNNSNLICSECVEKCNDLLLVKPSSEDVGKKMELLTSFDIYNYLTNKIAGQEAAIKSVSVVIYNHYKQLLYNEKSDPDHRFHSLVLGPSGSGKTMIFEQVSKLLNVPFVIIDSTTITSTGYSGNDCNFCIQALFDAAGHDLEKCNMGIVVLDEFDKCRKMQSIHHKDVGGEGVQQAFLKLLDGQEVSVQAGKRTAFDAASDLKINTKNILFIFCGAFDGIDEIIKNNKSSMDLILEDRQVNTLSNELKPEHLVEYGIIKELVGRFYYTIRCTALTKENLKDIICNVDNSILQQYKDILYLKDKIKLEIDDKVIDEVVNMAHGECGARSIKKIFNEILREVMFNAPNIQNQTYRITDKNLALFNESTVKL